MRNNLVPALTAMGGWDVRGVVSRGGASAAELAKRCGTEAVATIDHLPFDEIDTVVVSVTTAAVPSVLQALAPRARNLDLVLDTPPFAGARDLRFARHFAQFRLAVVAEDFMRFPPFDLMRDVVRDGAIGTPVEVVLDKTGFRYHGTALARSFFGFPLVRSFTSERETDGREVRYSLVGGGTIVVTGAYDPPAGTVTVHGTKASLRYRAPLVGDRPVTAHERDDPHTYDVRPIETDGAMLLGFDLSMPVGRLTYPVPWFDALRAQDGDWDQFNLLKTCGTIAVLEQLRSGRDTPYGATEGIYDAALGSLSRLLPYGITPISALANLAFRLLPRRVPDLPRRVAAEATRSRN
ncbi:MAG: hypothetical protein JWL83_1324 [Actinomycetia bacterium]|nr:hypothetical protein [Actinomycetes bacterium]